MHTFQPCWPEDCSDWPLPDFNDFRFASAHDVVAFCELEPATTWRTWPEFWHLDLDGMFTCSSKGSSLDNVRRLAADPWHLLDCRLTELGYPCPDRWVMLEARHPYHDCYEVNESDAEAFLTLRRELAEVGVTLLDTVVFDQEHRWWSLHELTTGTPEWPAHIDPHPTRRRPRVL